MCEVGSNEVLWYWLRPVLFDSYSLFQRVFLIDRRTGCAYLFSTLTLPAISALHYSEVIYKARGVMVPQYLSPLIIKQASSRGLWLLPIPPPYHPPRTEHKTEAKVDCIYRKGERERSKRTEGESYRFDWTTFLFSSSTEEISLKGCCSLSIGPKG